MRRKWFNKLKISARCQVDVRDHPFSTSAKFLWLRYACVSEGSIKFWFVNEWFFGFNIIIDQIMMACCFDGFNKKHKLLMSYPSLIHIHRRILNTVNPHTVHKLWTSISKLYSGGIWWQLFFWSFGEVTSPIYFMGKDIKAPLHRGVSVFVWFFFQRFHA